MPIKNEIGSQFFYEIDGQMKPLSIGMPSLETEDIVRDVDNTINNPEYLKGGEMKFKMSRKEYKRFKKYMRSVTPTYWTNNWRKMHCLTMIRRRMWK